MISNSKLEEVLKRLLQLHPKLIDLSLTRVTNLLKKLGNPEEYLPPVIHIAGTNGKGSTIAFMRSILEDAGYSVHVYSSPHLVNFNERIVLAGDQILDSSLINLLESVEAVNSGSSITFFEITTAAAFVAFATTPADITLIETGLGGRLDTTNVIKNSILSVLTPISLDHQNFLGNTLAKIAREKAGIIKPGQTCVIAKQHPQAMQSIFARSQDVGSALYIQNEDWKIKACNNKFIYTGVKSKWHLPLPNLPGAHQLNNSGLAIAALERCPRFSLKKNNFTNGIRSATWPGRLQMLTKGPLFLGVPNAWEIWLDGGHNKGAGKAISAFASKEWNDRPLHLICGMINSKDYPAFLSQLAKVTKSLHAIEIPGQPSSVKATNLASAGQNLKISAKNSKSAESAIKNIIKNSNQYGRILICGSLYLVGFILKENS